MIKRLIVGLTLLLILVGTVQAVTIETVLVGNLGNADDKHWEDGYGGVDYAYNIGKYEVTAGQYCDFLNAVAATDTYGLYSMEMDIESGWGWCNKGCNIKRNGTPGSYAYSVSEEYANRPVNCVSWGDAARFANWLHNGQGNGDTEDGAYNLSGTHPYYNLADSTKLIEALSAVSREADATWFIPTQDEWYKAAYHKNDGLTDNYFEYPTRSDRVPGTDMTEITNPGNNANYGNLSTTVVGEYELSDSCYGTFDQAGNVTEWTEDVFGDGLRRGLRGGSFLNGSTELRSMCHPSNSPLFDNIHVGFRIASVPKPILGDANYDGTVDEDDVAILAANWQASTGATWRQGDFNGDGAVNEIDATLMAANWQTAKGNANVPEPSTIVLLLMGAVSLLMFYWKR